MTVRNEDVCGTCGLQERDGEGWPAEMVQTRVEKGTEWL